jgi:hypothetical protein
VDAGGDDVVAALGHVDVVVGMDAPLEQIPLPLERDLLGLPI